MKTSAKVKIRGNLNFNHYLKDTSVQTDKKHELSNNSIWVIYCSVFLFCRNEGTCGFFKIRRLRRYVPNLFAPELYLEISGGLITVSSRLVHF